MPDLPLSVGALRDAADQADSFFQSLHWYHGLLLLIPLGIWVVSELWEGKKR